MKPKSGMFQTCFIIQLQRCILPWGLCCWFGVEVGDLGFERNFFSNRFWKREKKRKEKDFEEWHHFGTSPRMKHGTRSSKAPALAPWTSKASTHGALATKSIWHVNATKWVDAKSACQGAKKRKHENSLESKGKSKIRNCMKLLSQPLSSLISWPPLHLVKPGLFGHRAKHGRKWNSCNSFSKARKWCCRSLKNHEHSPTSNKATSFEKALSIASVLPFNFFDTNGNLAVQSSVPTSFWTYVHSAKDLHRCARVAQRPGPTWARRLQPDTYLQL